MLHGHAGAENPNDMTQQSLMGDLCQQNIVILPDADSIMAGSLWFLHSLPGPWPRAVNLRRLILP
eukprot:5884150-Prorocentrum_lima.AAC.1